MPKPKWNLNAIYISERLQESLRPISRCALTTVVAPMGYGKTTAVNWYLAERARNEDSRVVRISVYSDNLAIFWRSVQDAFARAGFAFLQDYACPTDAASGGLLADGLCHELAGEPPCYIFIDDFHLLTDRRAAAFLCTAAGRLPENVHLIVASRDLFLPAAEIVRLGSRVYQIGTGQLRLNHTELAIYAHRCGTELSDQQVETLLYYSEGWFSAVYLNLRALSERGALPDRSSDISAMFTAAMIDPLSPRQREFLAVMGLADEFTVEMARFITEDPGAETLLTGLTEQNAFVKCLPDGVTYRFHHMMKECAERAFLTLDAAKQAAYRERYGAWYEGRRQYLHAMAAYHRSGDYDALLQVVQADAGILLASLKPADVLAVLDQCPAAVLKAHPFALLVLMRSMFNWRQIPRMLELKDLLMAAIEEHPELPAEERGNLLGECDLIMSFLCYNDISAMSRLHRSASSQMSHPAISIQKSGGWTFGSPSVLMMFYRGPGELEQELAEMDECMPHYYKITDGHGRGAEAICRGMHYALVALHLQIQTAAAYEQLGKRPEARKLLDQALEDAAPDGLLLPFAENYDLLKPLLESAGAQEKPLVRQIIRLGETGEARRQQLRGQTARPAALAALTDREYALAQLAAQRLSNREIAEKLFLSEGSVRQYINQLYTKLQIQGDPRSKRKRLVQLLDPKT